VATKQSRYVRDAMLYVAAWPSSCNRKTAFPRTSPDTHQLAWWWWHATQRAGASRLMQVACAVPFTRPGPTSAVASECPDPIATRCEQSISIALPAASLWHFTR